MNINTYDEYGVPDPTNAGLYGYTGQVYLQELGLYYYKARMYDPLLGRLLQTDPVGYEDQMNLYAYVGNDPININDTTGEWGVVGAFYGAIAGGFGGYVASGGDITSTLAGAFAGGAVNPFASSAVGMPVGAVASAGG